MSIQLQGRYFGQGKPLFLLYVKTAFLTLISLGIYRFWGKTRIRKYIWSAVSLGEDSFEYTGSGLEKFLGFLVAVVILAVYLGIIQMALLFFGLSLLGEATTQAEQLAQIGVFYLTFFAVLPLLLFAQYRARRYKLSRTRWRGLRFGMENGAWGYVLRAFWYYFLSAITFGILMPLSTFKLEKYMADRTWYGNANFHQSGRWQSLYGGFRHVFIALGIIVVSIVMLSIQALPFLAVVGLFVGYIWFLIGLVHYRVFAFNYLTEGKVLGEKVTFLSEARTGTIVKIAIIGSIVIGLLIAVIAGVVSGIAYQMRDALIGLNSLPVGPTIISIVLYVAMLLITGGLNLVMIIQPVIEHIVNNITVVGGNHLDDIQQRPGDDGGDAEGFADALDVGGAI
ncbi:MAG: DUF898 family protein [Paracoccaceae bacterium]